MVFCGPTLSGTTHRSQEQRRGLDSPPPHILSNSSLMMLPAPRGLFLCFFAAPAGYGRPPVHAPRFPNSKKIQYT